MLLDIVLKIRIFQLLFDPVWLLPLDLNPMLIKFQVQLLGLLRGLQLEELKKRFYGLGLNE